MGEADTDRDASAVRSAEAGNHVPHAVTYGEYLRLDILLDAQKPLSDHHDEMLFIIIHQTTELWLKLVRHELAAAMALIRGDDLQPAFKNLARISRIQEQLIKSWDVLATMTPSEYVRFRDWLGISSGFQSVQYRLVEFALGNKQAEITQNYRHSPTVRAELDAALAAPTVYDEALGLLARRGFAIDADVLGRDVTRRYCTNASVLAAWLEIYRDPKRWWDLYQLAEELVDLEDWFQQWRFRHMTTVHRIIGLKPGTGGTAGVGYLRHVLDTVFFPELWEVRTAL
jgi:tryptophan 2,3-dioxygenase